MEKKYLLGTPINIAEGNWFSSGIWTRWTGQNQADFSDKSRISSIFFIVIYLSYMYW